MLIIPKLFIRESPHKDQSQIEHRVADCKYSFEGLGFPERFLEFKFPYIGSKAIAELVISELRSGGIEAEGREQGLDHGVWAPLLVDKHAVHNSSFML